MKTRLYKTLNKCLAGILSLFGLTGLASCMVEYGSPHATYQLTGIVTDKTTGNPLPDIRLAIDPSRDTIRTDQNGKFFHQMDGDFFSDTLTITAEDTDGPENGGTFATASASFTFEQADQISEGDGDWYQGAFRKTIDIAMEPQADGSDE